MKRFLLLTLCIPVVSCTVMHGNKQKGTYTYASVGGDTKGYAQTADGATAEAVTTSSAFQELNKTIRFGVGAAAFKSVASSALSTYSSVKNASTAAGAAVDKAKIAADVEKASIAAQPAPEVVVP